jgi:hypothetical protein
MRGAKTFLAATNRNSIEGCTKEMEKRSASVFARMCEAKQLGRIETLRSTKRSIDIQEEYFSPKSESKSEGKFYCSPSMRKKKFRGEKE